MSTHTAPHPDSWLWIKRRAISVPRTALILVLVLALLPAALVLPNSRAVAAAPRPVTTAPAAPQKTAPGAPAAPAAPQKTAPAAPTAPLGTYTVSRSVFAFLSAGLGLPLGGSPKLTGTPSGTMIGLTVGAPTRLGLPTGVAAPAFGAAKIVIDKQTGTLTVTASAAGPAPAALNVRIAHASTSALPASDLAASLSMTAAVLGSKITLAGPVTDPAGKPVLALSGALGAADVLKAGVVTLGQGVAVTLSTAGGLQVHGAATVGGGAAATAVHVVGTVTDPTSWTLHVTPPSVPATWQPFNGIAETPTFTGLIAGSAGTVTFDLTTTAPVTWTPLSKVSLAAGKVEFANTPAPGIAAGASWIDLAGAVTMPAGQAGALSATGSVLIDTATGRGRLAGTQQGKLALSPAPAVSLSDVTLSGALRTGASTTTGTITGTGSITVGTDTPVNATLSVTSGGVLVVDFSTDASAFGLGTAGQFGEVLWAAAPVPSYAVASTGKPISLGAGFSSATGVAATPPTTPPSTPPTTTTTPPPPAKGSTYAISSGAELFLNSIGLKLGSTTLTGTVSGRTLTLTAAAPNSLPIKLPTGDRAVSFGPTTLVIDTSADTLTVTASASAANGTAATLSATVNHVSKTTLPSADLSATLHMTGLNVFGASADLDGSITYSAGKVGVAVMGTLTSDAVVSPGILTIHAGTVVSYGSKDGLTVNGSVDLGAEPAKFTVAFTGSITDLKNWHLSVSNAGAPGFHPADGLTITPNFTGTLTDTGGSIGFDVSGADVTSWQASGAVTVGVKHIEVSNLAPPTTVTCPADLKDGQLWLDASGTVTYAPAGSDVNVSGSVEACVAPAAKKVTLTAGVTGTLLASTAGFQIADVSLTIDGDLAAKTLTVKATAHVTVTAAGKAGTFTVGMSFGSDGSFVAGAAVTDLGTLGLSGTNGWLLIASKENRSFNPSDIGILNADGSDITPFDLPAGVTVTMAFSLDSKDVTALQKLHIPLNGASVQLMATLSTTGFKVKIEVNFGDGDQGLTLVDTASGIKLVLDTFYVDFDLSETSVTLGLGGTAYLQVPSVVPGINHPSGIEVGVNGTINLVTLSFSVGVTLSGACKAEPCTWTDAFGIQGLNLDSLSGSIGIDFETAIPTPTIALKVDNLVLPTGWASAIGMVPGTVVSLALDLNLSQPLVNIAIDPGPGSTVALTPLSIFSRDPNVIDSFRVNKAHLLFAPLGGTEADGTVVTPGVGLDFTTTIGGVQANVAASVNLDPANPSITADIRIDRFSIGSVSFASPKLHLAIAPTAADFSISGGFTESSTGVSFSASVDLGVSTSLLHAAVSLDITGGLPGYLLAAGSLNGSVTVDSNGLNLSASGYLYLSIGNYYFSAINVSYSGGSSTLWHDLNNDAAAVAAAFVQAFGSGPGSIYNALKGLGFNLQQIEQALASAFTEGATAVIDQLRAAGVDLHAAIQAAISSLGATENQIAAALNDAGWGVDSITSELKTDFGNTGAALYNALASIGAAGSSVINSIGSLFNNGSYNLWVGSAPEVMDVSGGSQSPGGSVIQYTANGGTNQDWFVLPTDSGYAELVNRNSGQCLTNPASTGQVDLVQEPCTGDPTQQWDLGVYQGDSDLRFQSRVMHNRYSGLVAEVTGGSLWRGATVEQYRANGGSNQRWTFLPAA